MSDVSWPPSRRPLTAPGPGPQPPLPAVNPADGGEGDPSAPSAAAPSPAAPSAAVPPPEVVETGNGAVDAALARLASAGDVPAEARAGVYGEVHDLLRDTLAGLDERAGGTPTPLNAIR